MLGNKDLTQTTRRSDCEINRTEWSAIRDVTVTESAAITIRLSRGKDVAWPCSWSYRSLVARWQLSGKWHDTPWLTPNAPPRFFDRQHLRLRIPFLTSNFSILRELTIIGTNQHSTRPSVTSINSERVALFYWLLGRSPVNTLHQSTRIRLINICFSKHSFFQTLKYLIKYLHRFHSFLLYPSWDGSYLTSSYTKNKGSLVFIRHQ